jgi:hypothetical protein
MNGPGIGRGLHADHVHVGRFGGAHGELAPGNPHHTRGLFPASLSSVLDGGLERLRIGRSRGPMGSRGIEPPPHAACHRHCEQHEERSSGVTILAGRPPIGLPLVLAPTPVSHGFKPLAALVNVPFPPAAPARRPPSVADRPAAPASR